MVRIEEHLCHLVCSLVILEGLHLDSFIICLERERERGRAHVNTKRGASKREWPLIGSGCLFANRAAGQRAHAGTRSSIRLGTKCLLPLPPGTLAVRQLQVMRERERERVTQLHARGGPTTRNAQSWQFRGPLATVTQEIRIRHISTPVFTGIPLPHKGGYTHHRGCTQLLMRRVVTAKDRKGSERRGKGERESFSQERERERASVREG